MTKRNPHKWLRWRVLQRITDLEVANAVLTEKVAALTAKIQEVRDQVAAPR